MKVFDLSITIHRAILEKIILMRNFMKNNFCHKHNFIETVLVLKIKI